MPGDEHFYMSIPAVACFLDPRHKTLKFIANAAVQSQMKNYILHLMRCEAVANPAQENTEEPPPKKKSVFSYLDGDFNNEETTYDPEDEMLRYQAEPVLIRNPFEWWRHYAKRFPTLAKLARKFLCIMGTSVPSESSQLQD